MSSEIHLTRTINKETKYYGLPLTGLVVGGIFGAIILSKYDFVFALIAASIGFIVGTFISNAWHKGKVQRWIYWHLPISRLSRNKYLPPSDQRTFM